MANKTGDGELNSASNIANYDFVIKTILFGKNDYSNMGKIVLSPNDEGGSGEINDIIKNFAFGLPPHAFSPLKQLNKHISENKDCYIIRELGKHSSGAP